MERVIGIEPTTFSLGSCEHPDVSGLGKDLTKSGVKAWTYAWTKSQDEGHADRLERLAEELRSLSPEEHRRLMDMLGEVAENGRGNTTP